MKSLMDFLKTTALGGFFVLLPVVLLYLVFTETLQLVIALATPLADLFPKGTFDDAKFPVLAAIVVILGASFLIGLVMCSPTGRRLGEWIDRSVLDRVPMYGALKSLTRSFGGGNEDSAFRPAVMTSKNGEQEIVYVIEDHGDDQMTILVPWAPTPFAGSVKIVDQSSLRMLDTNLGEVSKVLTHWGVGVGKLLAKGRSDKS